VTVRRRHNSASVRCSGSCIKKQPIDEFTGRSTTGRRIRQRRHADFGDQVHAACVEGWQKPRALAKKGNILRPQKISGASQGAIRRPPNAQQPARSGLLAVHWSCSTSQKSNGVDGRHVVFPATTPRPILHRILNGNWRSPQFTTSCPGRTS